jgi:hypothetical protein
MFFLRFTAAGATAAAFMYPGVRAAGPDSVLPPWRLIDASCVHTSSRAHKLFSRLPYRRGGEHARAHTLSARCWFWRSMSVSLLFECV